MSHPPFSSHQLLQAEDRPSPIPDDLTGPTVSVAPGLIGMFIVLAATGTRVVLLRHHLAVAAAGAASTLRRNQLHLRLVLGVARFACTALVQTHGGGAREAPGLRCIPTMAKP